MNMFSRRRGNGKERIKRKAPHWLWQVFIKMLLR